MTYESAHCPKKHLLRAKHLHTRKTFATRETKKLVYINYTSFSCDAFKNDLSRQRFVDYSDFESRTKEKPFQTLPVLQNHRQITVRNRSPRWTEISYGILNHHQE